MFAINYSAIVRAALNVLSIKICNCSNQRNYELAFDGCIHKYIVWSQTCLTAIKPFSPCNTSSGNFDIRIRLYNCWTKNILMKNKFILKILAICRQVQVYMVSRIWQPVQESPDQ